MNAETLHQLLEVLNALGVQGKEAFIAWLVLDKLPAPLVMSGFLFALYKVVARMISAHEEEQRAAYAAQCLRSIRNTLRIGTEGRYTSHEHAQVIQKIEALMMLDRGQR